MKTVLANAKNRRGSFCAGDPTEETQGGELNGEDTRYAPRLIFGLLFWAACLSARGAPLEASLTNRAPALTLLEAVRETLAHDPNIQIQRRQVQVGKGGWESASGQFDPALVMTLSSGQSRLERSESDREIGGLTNVLTAVQDITTYRAAVTNQFRTGISLYTGLELNRFNDNLFQTEAANRADVSFVLRVPLLRGAGRTAVEAGEKAARMSYEAAGLDLWQTTSARVFNTVSAYWNCLAAVERLRVLRQSQQRATSLARAVGELARIGELPAGELLQAQADEAQKTAAVSVGEQALLQTRQDLAVATGLALERMSTPPLPLSTFPAVETNPPSPHLDESKLLLQSLNRRADYQSSLKIQEAAQVLEAAARRNTRPQLDLSLEAGYATLNESSSLSAYFTTIDPLRASGPRVFGTLSLQWPFGNRTARGLLLQRTAEQQQAQLRSEALARTIYAGISVALKALENSRAQWEKSQLAVRTYELAVAQEQEKLRLRTSTILDVITLTDRMEGAQLSELSARADYWIAVARCRYETGWLMSSAGLAQGIITLQDLIALPPWYQEEGNRSVNK